MNNRGLITPVKRAYNLSARGKDKIRTVLNFLDQYKIIAGDLAINRINIMKTALEYLDTHRGHRFQDGEGSFGMKSSGLQPYFAVGMKDQKIIELLKEFVGYGNVRLRKDGLYHLEITNRNILKSICKLFLDRYPLRHERQRRRLTILQQLLNDYTPKSLNLRFQRT